MKDSKDLQKVFSGLTMKKAELFFLYGFYVLAAISCISMIMSFSLASTEFLAVSLSSISMMICIIIPSYRFRKNKAPNIIVRDDGIDIKFNELN